MVGRYLPDRRADWTARIIIGVICAVILGFAIFVILGVIGIGQGLALIMSSKVDMNAAAQVSAAREGRTEERLHAAFVDGVRTQGIGSPIALPAVESQSVPCQSNQHCDMTAADSIAFVGEPQEVQPGIDIQNAAQTLGVSAREIDYHVELVTVTQIPYLRNQERRTRDLLVRTYSVMPYSITEDLTGIQAPAATAGS